MTKLITRSNPKAAKAAKFGYYQEMVHLSPYKTSGYGDVCPYATPGCVASCLNTAGNPIWLKGKIKARKWRTGLFFTNRPAFMAMLEHELGLFEKRAKKYGLKPVMRLNGTSDIAWPAKLMKRFPNIQFNEYTKNPNWRSIKSRMAAIPNLYICYSFNERDGIETALDMLKHGINVAVVFQGKLPETWLGYPVINGDSHDLRFLDPVGVIVGLKAKNKAKKDNTGFAIPE